MMSDYGYVAKYINNPFKFNFYESKLLISSMKEDKKIPKSKHRKLFLLAFISYLRRAHVVF